MYKNAIVRNSITTSLNSWEKTDVYMNETRRNSITLLPTKQLNESIYDDTGIPTIEEIDKLLHEDPTRLEDLQTPI